MTTICTFCHGGGEQEGEVEGEKMGEEEGLIRLEEQVCHVVEENASSPSAFDTARLSGIKESPKRSTDISDHKTTAT